MKKRYLILIVGIILVGLFSYKVESNNVSVKDVFAPNTLKVTAGTAVTKAIGGVNYTATPTTNSDGVVVYSLMKNTESVSTTEVFAAADGTPQVYNDKALSYIINHGYNNKNTFNKISGTTDNNMKYFITQMAIWLYIYENKSSYSRYCISTDNSYSTCDFTDNSGNVITASTVRNAINSSSDSYLKSIITLVDGAKNDSSKNITLNSISNKKIDYDLASDGKSLITSLITPTISSGDTFKYSVTITNPNNYTIQVLDNSGNVITPTNISGGFKLKVSFEDIYDTDLSSIGITISTNISKNSSITDFRVTSSTKKGPKSDTLLTAGKNQRFPNVVYAEEVSTPINTSVNLYNLVRIYKYDSKTNKLLSDAKLEIKDSNDKVISTVTTKGEVIDMHLDNGTYKVCETVAPDGYELLTTCVDFTVDGKSAVRVNVANNAIEIPDTFMGAMRVGYVFGILLIVVGATTFAYVIVKNKKKTVKEL